MRCILLTIFALGFPSVTAVGQDEIPLKQARRTSSLVQDLDLEIAGGGNVAYRIVGMRPSDSLLHQRFLMDAFTSANLQKQIDFSADQKKSLDKIRKQISAAYQQLKKKFPDRTNNSLPKEVRKQMQKDFSDQYKQIREKAEREFKETLLPHQLKLIRQLKFTESVRSYGFSWTVSNKPFDFDIKTTPEQKKELNKIKQETESAIQKKIEEMRKAAKSKMLKALDTNQRKTIEELEGDSAKNKKTKL